MGFEHVAHTADVTIRAWGADFGEALVEVCRGATAVLTPPESLATGHHRRVALVAQTRERLVFDLLAEVIYWHDIDGFLPAAGAIVVQYEKEHWSATGELRGAVHKGEAVHGGIKAVTYHELSVADLPHKTVIHVTLDL